MTTLGRIDNQPITSATTIASPSTGYGSISSANTSGGRGGGGSGNGNGENRIRSQSQASSLSSSSTSTIVPSYYNTQQQQPSLIPGSTSRPYFLMFAFWFISFGYMLPWTGLGSLISYYKYTYSAHFYVEIYCAYYLLGLPVALLQYKFDEMIDLRIGSQNAFLIRGVICYSLLILVQYTLLWVDSKAWMIVLFSLLGLASWWLHGTASMMVSMFPKTLIAYLQIGFRSPEIYTVIADSLLSLGKTASIKHIRLFFEINCIILLFALINWIITVNTNTATQYFEEKDDRIKLHHERNYPSYSRIYGADDMNIHHRQHDNDEENVNETTSLMSNCVEADEEEWCAVKPPGSSTRSTSTSNTPIPSVHNSSIDLTCIDNVITSTNSPLVTATTSSDIPTTTTTTTTTTMNSINMDKCSPRISSKSITKSKRESIDNNGKNIDYDDDDDGNSSSIVSSNRRSLCKSCWRKISHNCSKMSYNMLYYCFVQKKKDNDDNNTNDNNVKKVINNDEKIFNEVFPLCCTLMITMFCSIFQASFYAYVDSKRGWNIEQILYFTRLFCDLLGRPLTFLPRPKLFQTTNGLFNFSVVRAISMLIFFAYTFIPNCPQSDIFIVIYVALFSLASGYVSVLTYEYAAGDDLTTAERAHATNIMNMCFQIAAFTAVSMSVLFTADLW